MENKTYTNRLSQASSPYLLQHAHNPVDWYEWGDEAFEKAKREDKLVLVSIGYSACHWCHVMERECFEKEDTAAIMNEHFICIKVDREERPDVDQLYMDAVQLLTGRGGWPLNCFTLPDGRPLHGGTYFPKQEWERVLKSLSDFYRNRREEALEYATELTDGIRKLDVLVKPSSSDLFSIEKLNEVINGRTEQFDLDFGGFGWAPKFPMPDNWELFLQQYTYTGNPLLLEGVTTTLDKMAEGGLYDQVGGGFARYSTDAFWKVPHFEKMLYDNAQLVSLYSRAYRVTGKPLYEKTVRNTLRFIRRELTNDDGAFFSALDADSEGKEGRFYIWSHKELQQVLGDDEPLFSLYFSVDAYGNWEDGLNILYKTRSNEALEKLTGKSIEEIERTIAACNEKLLAERAKRVRPSLDDKIITSWNALMIKAYADAYLTWGDKEWLEAALKGASFIRNIMWKDQRLSRICKNNKVTIHGFAEDYAITCEAMIRLYEASGEESWLELSHELLKVALREFYDEERGLFYFRAKSDGQLIAPKTDLNDDVIPSSNAVFARCLLILGYFYDQDRYHEMADRMILNIQEKASQFPAAYSNWLQVMLMKQHGVKQIIAAGEDSVSRMPVLASVFTPDAIFASVTRQSHIPLLGDKKAGKDTVYYLCEHKTCSLPVNNVNEIWNLIRRNR